MSSDPGLLLFFGSVLAHRRHSRADVSPTSGNLEVVLPGVGGFLSAPSLSRFLWGVMCGKLCGAQLFWLLVMEDALRLREAAVTAVCSKEYGKLAWIIQQLAKVAPSEEVLLASGMAT